VNAVALPLLVAALACGALLAGCGGGGGAEASPPCTSVQGGPDDPVSLWACADDDDVTALIDHYEFSGCRLVEGMDAEATQEDRAYQCMP
jgi:hypothetical protein